MCRRSLTDDSVYVWADGIHSGLRGAGERLCVLVVIGVNARPAYARSDLFDKRRELMESWADYLAL